MATAKVESRSKPRLAAYPPPPDAWKDGDHYFHYGWPVTNRMLRKALLKVPLELPEHDSYAGILCNRLELLLKFHGINALLCKSDEFCESRGRVFTSEEDGERYVQFISIGCTCSRKYFWRRPDPETLEDLIKIMGEELRWMENASTKKEFPKGLLAMFFSGSSTRSFLVHFSSLSLRDFPHPPRLLQRLHNPSVPG